VRRDPRAVVLAKQWQATVEAALEFGTRAPATQWYEVRYEDLVADPRDEMRKILDFLGLSPIESVLQRFHEQTDPTRNDKWRDELDPALLESVTRVIKPTLDRLGYG
jgi:hypothetical protein